MNRIGFSQRLELRQSQALVMTPQLQQAIKMLQLSNLELAEFVDGEIEQNPLLEPGESATWTTRRRLRRRALWRRTESRLCPRRWPAISAPSAAEQWQAAAGAEGDGTGGDLGPDAQSCERT